MMCLGLEHLIRSNHHHHYLRKTEKSAVSSKVTGCSVDLMAETEVKQHCFGTEQQFFVAFFYNSISTTPRQLKILQ
jgi:hypothetical protein